jgi:Mn-dependent DtxR family transcriptional regulator
MGEESLDDLKKRIIDFLSKEGKSKNRKVADALGADKRLVDKAIGDLSKEDVVEYLYLNGSFIQLKNK